MLEVFIDKTLKFSLWVLGSEVVTALAAITFLAL